jgi:hypothetical protein
MTVKTVTSNNSSHSRMSVRRWPSRKGPPIVPLSVMFRFTPPFDNYTLLSASLRTPYRQVEKSRGRMMVWLGLRQGTF